MGTAQSSTAKSAPTRSFGKKSKAASSGSGRKTRQSLIAPELQASEVSFQHHDLTDVSATNLEDDHPVMIVEESLSMESTDSDETEEEDGTCRKRYLGCPKRLTL